MNGKRIYTATTRGKILSMTFSMGVMILASLAMVPPRALIILAVPCCFILMTILVVGRSTRVWLLATLGLAVVLSVVKTNWPVKLAFATAKPRLEYVAKQVRNGDSLDEPFWAGLYHIEAAEIDADGVVCCWTRMRYAGRSGFVCSPADTLPFNLMAQTPLYDGWHYIVED